MKAIITISLILLFPSFSFSELCGYSTHINIPQPGQSCADLTEVPSYSGTLDTGCYVKTSSMDSCVVQYQICCPDTVRAYEQSNTFKRMTTVTVGSELSVQSALCSNAETQLLRSDCADGYSKKVGLDGCAVSIISNPEDYSKSNVTATAYGRVACSKFSPNTSVLLNPTAGGGGTTTESVAELQKVNTALNSIKSVLDSVPNTTNPLLTDIKTLLQDGLNFNSAALESGIGQVGVNTATANEILTSINNKLTQSCTTVWDPNINCGYFPDPGCPQCPPTYSCLGGSVTNCKGIDVADSAALSKLQEIKDAIVASGAGGGTVNADMTETNSILSGIGSILSDIRNFLNGESTLQAYSDTSSSEDDYSHSDFLTSTPSADDYKSQFDSFVTNMKSTPLYGLLNGFFAAVPNVGSPVVSFNGGRYGQHQYDFSSWGSILQIIKAFVLIAFAAATLRIIFLKGGAS